MWNHHGLNFPFFFPLLWAPVERQTSAEPAIDVVLYVLAINVGQYVLNCFCYKALKGLLCRIPDLTGTTFFSGQPAANPTDV
jgi:hypothetical protein